MNTKPCKYKDNTVSYFAGQLSEDEQAKAEEHIADCPQCCQTIAQLTKSMFSEENDEEKAFLDKHAKESASGIRELVKNFLNNESKADKTNNVISLPIKKINNPTRKIISGWGSPQIALAASLIVVLLVGVIVFFLLKNNPTNLDSQLSESVAVLKEVNKIGRPTGLRLEGFEHSSPIVDRGKNTEKIQLRLQSAEDTFKVIVASKPTPENFDLFAQVLIMTGKYDVAIKELSSAILLNPKDLRLLTDLTVAYSGKKDYQSALEIANKALSINENYLVGVFNRALIYKALGQNDKARLDFEKYLTLDSTSPWATEAKESLK